MILNPEPLRCLDDPGYEAKGGGGREANCHLCPVAPVLHVLLEPHHTGHGVDLPDPGAMPCLYTLGLGLQQVRQAAARGSSLGPWTSPQYGVFIQVSAGTAALPSSLAQGLFISAGNGPCLGFRKPKQPYQWLSYQEVSDGGQAPLCLPSQTCHLRGLWAPCWVSEGHIFLAWPICQTSGSCLTWLPDTWVGCQGGR